MPAPATAPASCLITGGLGDIGQAAAAAIRAADPALTIHLCDIRAPHQALGPGQVFSQLDVADAAGVERWVAGIPDLRLAVVNAASSTLGSLRELTFAGWRREIDITLNGAAYAAIAAARCMAVQGGGRMVVVGSWAAERAHLHIPAYCAAKAGLRMLTRLLALEYASEQVVVNELAPGLVDAGLSAQVWRAQPAPVREAAARAVPNGRLITAAEVGAEIAHLLLHASPHITGSTITMTGGIDLRGPLP